MQDVVHILHLMSEVTEPAGLVTSGLGFVIKKVIILQYVADTYQI